MTKWLQTTLWGISISLSWMWGLGLFFSVQFTHQFGVLGLLMFAIPNAFGLMLFGLATHIMSKRDKQNSETLANFFTGVSRPFRLVFFLYQVLAITLTIFAIIRYLWQPLNLQPGALYLPLTILIVLAAACLFGEEFNIKRIKYSHGVLFVILLASITFLLAETIGNSGPFPILEKPVPETVTEMAHDIKFWSYLIPIFIGFLVGPWLDLQQWQRAIQMRRENISILPAYIIGGTIFFALLLFHGSLASWGLQQGAAQYLIHSAFDNLTYAQSILTSLFYQILDTTPWLFTAYATFICICILTTLDSGYIAIRWFLSQNVKNSKSAIFALIPEWFTTSPVPTFIFAGAFTLFAVIVKLELEYFMVFYATFFVGYSALLIYRCFTSRLTNTLPQIKMFSIGSLAVVIFAYGYFLKLPMFLILGSVLPLAYVIWMIFKPDGVNEFVTDTEKLEAIADREITDQSPATDRVRASETEKAQTTPEEPQNKDRYKNQPPHSLAGHFEDKWFVHTFLATYADTNSVGNVYFGMYAMWVGKTRELFFNRCLPKFNLKTSPYYILTRSFEHKFVRETREFEQVSVKIRIANYNRKFVTLEHQIFDSTNHLLGKGQQSLMFVSSSDYALIDIPPEVYSAFIQYA